MVKTQRMDERENCIANIIYSCSAAPAGPAS